MSRWARGARLCGLVAATTVVLTGAVAGVMRSRSAEGCALVGRRIIPVRIDAEEALIVWDAAHRREHFIRQARFRGEGREPFGFLVPTPTQPELAEADERVFDRLTRFYGAPEPPRRHARRSRGVGGDAVEVVAVARVAGLDATVLRASDATALARWLQGRGFASRQGLTDWLARYVAGGWYVTAFRYNGGRQVQFGSRAVRLSFSADRPFYPYAEPGDQTQSEPRTLRVTVVSDARMEGEIDGHAWTARTGYADRPDLSAALRGVVPDGVVSAGAWMTTFEEPSSRRGTHDLFFRRATDQGVVAPSIVASRWVVVRTLPSRVRPREPSFDLSY